MNAALESQWDRFQKSYTWFDSIGLGLDFSRTKMPLDYAQRMQSQIDRALAEMQALEDGAIANPDEGRMVGHYWLRNLALAPTAEIRRDIERTIDDVKAFASDIHKGKIQGASGAFTQLLLIGIGGSALGPQFLSQALGHPKRDKLQIQFLDSTDPDGFDRVLAGLDSELASTLCMVISKSGTTKETRNGMIEVQAAYQAQGLAFDRHAVAVTGDGSELDQYAGSNRWIRTFPMWDWVGDRTSELSAVGLLPTALQGFDIDGLLSGAMECDNVSRSADCVDNAALILAVFFHYIVNPTGSKAMVVLPYEDRLELFSRYLQQLVMESLGKQCDRDEMFTKDYRYSATRDLPINTHYIQQLRDGVPNFFCVFLEVLKNREGRTREVEPNVSSGDYLTGFLLGTRDALFEKDRESLLLSLARVDAFQVGASLININAYHQPGAEAGKKAVGEILRIEANALRCLSAKSVILLSSAEIASEIGVEGHEDFVFRICEHLAANDWIRGGDIHRPPSARFASK